jgi:hypothetical protein
MTVLGSCRFGTSSSGNLGAFCQLPHFADVLAIRLADVAEHLFLNPHKNLKLQDLVLSHFSENANAFLSLNLGEGFARRHSSFYHVFTLP